MTAAPSLILVVTVFKVFRASRLQEGYYLQCGDILHTRTGVAIWRTISNPKSHNRVLRTESSGIPSIWKLVFRYCSYIPCNDRVDYLVLTDTDAMKSYYDQRPLMCSNRKAQNAVWMSSESTTAKPPFRVCNPNFVE